eukprot:159914-Chlamydomonas_euryale.AAC.4
MQPLFSPPRPPHCNRLLVGGIKRVAPDCCSTGLLQGMHKQLWQPRGRACEAGLHVQARAALPRVERPIE